MKYKAKQADRPNIFFPHTAIQNVTKLPIAERIMANQFRKTFLNLTFFN
jgi:hypothetical protein